MSSESFDRGMATAEPAKIGSSGPATWARWRRILPSPAKNIQLATALADELGVPFALGKRAEEQLVAYRDGGFAADDVLATVKSIEARAGIVVRGRAMGALRAARSDR